MDHAWGSMLRTVRAAVMVLLLGGIGLTVPPQTRDMLAFLDDGPIWPPISFQLALIVLAGSAWFWSRAALAARFGIDDNRQNRPAAPNFDWAAYTWLPRLIFVAGFLVEVVIAATGRSLYSILGAIILAALGVFLLEKRRRGPRVNLPPASRYDMRAWLHGGARSRLDTLLGRAPGGAVTATSLLVLGLIPLALGAIESFTFALKLPNHLAAVFPGPGIAVLLLGLMIGPLVTLTFLFDGLTFAARLGSTYIGLSRPPVLSVLSLYVFVLVPALFHVHTVRLVDGSAIGRKPLDRLFTEWRDACAPKTGPVQPIIVAVSGGATRAGLWGAAVIDRVLQAQQENGPALFAVSSVSGGSLGVAGVMTLLSLESLPCRAAGVSALRPTGNATVPLAGDALGPLLGGWLLNDIPRSTFDPFAALVRWTTGRRPNGGDSAEAIERAFEDLWSQVRRKPEASAAAEWDQPFLSLFYTDRSGSYRKGMPLWFANGTDATTGNRVITTPIAAPEGRADPSPWPFRGARDFHVLMGGDVPVSTAINNTARFPYLEPFGEMLSHMQKRAGSLVDGGYFENEGLQTALDLAEWLGTQSTQDRPVLPIIVQATGDGEADITRAEVMTCDNASDGAFIPDNKNSAMQILAPLFGLYHVRGGHSAVLLRQMHDQFCSPRPRFVHFYLPAYQGLSVPLNWVLSDQTARFIWTAFSDDQVSNAAQTDRLKAALTRGGS